MPEARADEAAIGGMIALIILVVVLVVAVLGAAGLLRFLDRDDDLALAFPGPRRRQLDIRSNHVRGYGHLSP